MLSVNRFTKHLDVFYCHKPIIGQELSPDPSIPPNIFTQNVAFIHYEYVKNARWKTRFIHSLQAIKKGYTHEKVFFLSTTTTLT